jgi:CheY-like chemotaxis protein
MIRVLLVDDEASIRMLLRTALEVADFQVETASSAREAIARLPVSHFDLVITDMRMETVTSGYEVARVASRLDPRPTIVILTAFPIPASQWRAAGADALIVKGTDMLQLPERLRALMKPSVQDQDSALERVSRLLQKRD